jgi:hypothetical protein
MIVIPLAIALAACASHDDKPAPTTSTPSPVADSAVTPPKGIDESPLPDRVWLRYQAITVAPCQGAGRIMVADDGTVSVSVDRRHGCAVPAYKAVATMEPAALSALHAQVAHAGIASLAPAYRSSEKVNDGIFERYEVRIDGQVRRVDVKQIAHPALAPIADALLRLMPEDLSFSLSR